MGTRLTSTQKWFLTTTAFLVRAYIVLAAIAFAAWCVYVAEDKYSAVSSVGLHSDDIPKPAVWANIFSIYIPIISGAFAYLFAEKQIVAAPLAPNGFATAVLRDAMAILVMTIVLWIPVWQYDQPGPIKDVISFLAWYQSVAFGLASVAFVYYYRSALKPFIQSANAPPAAGSTQKAKQPEPEPV